mmetsp:Transcript_14421/g.22541  ORF Transcript_14421/g.22541 Transcript_14421/m.22541 type:complete len:212 (+) Transcript_14421:1053-1688(+)
MEGEQSHWKPKDEHFEEEDGQRRRILLAHKHKGLPRAARLGHVALQPALFEQQNAVCRHQQHVDVEAQQEEQEVVVVADTDTVSDPRTVMVESLDAIIAHLTVEGARRTHDLARDAPFVCHDVTVYVDDLTKRKLHVEIRGGRVWIAVAVGAEALIAVAASAAAAVLFVFAVSGVGFERAFVLIDAWYDAGVHFGGDDEEYDAEQTEHESC